MVVDKNLNFIGNGSAKNIIIDGQNKGPLFTVNRDVTVIFQNITFMHGLNDCGGAIATYVSTLNVDNCIFINNTAHGGTSNGGAIDNEGIRGYYATATITNSVFIGNYAYHDGGAITTYYANTLIKNCEFYNNGAYRDGGAIRVKFSKSHVIDNCTFMYNHAASYTSSGGLTGWGGAIYSWSDSVSTIKNSIICNNYAQEAGGAIATASQLTVTNCIITNNTADWMGGAIYVYQEGEGTSADTVVNYNDIYNNTITTPTAFEAGGEDVYLSSVIPDGTVLNFENNYWGTNNPLNSTDYHYTWEERFDTNGKASNPTTWLIHKFDSILSGENITLYYKNGTSYEVRLTDNKNNPLANKVISFSIIGKVYNFTTDENGVANLPINLIPNSYEVTATFNGDEEYTKSTVTNTVTVLSTIEGKDITLYYKNGTGYTVKILNNHGKVASNENVAFNIIGKFYNLTSDENGIATLPINLNPGKYIVTAIYNGLMYSNNITVLSTLQSDDLVKYFGNGSQLKVKALDNLGNPTSGALVTFNFYGKFYKINTDENGIATLNINLNPGNYIITAIDSTNGLQRSFNIKVLSIIKTQDVTMTVSKRVPFTATVLDEQGNLASNRQVSFNVNGKIYTGVSDVNGVASLSLNLPQGRYIVTTMYNGEYTSNTVQINGN